jgi:hypothetical protein
MSFTWPSGVIGSVQSETPVALGSPQTSPLTGTTQGGGSSVIMWSLKLDFPPISDVSKIRDVRTIFAQHKQDTVIIPIRQPGIVVGSSGTVTVNTGHTAGTKTLPLTGIAGGFSLFKGQFISVQTGGIWYLYTLAADSLAGSSSRTVTLTSTTRAAHVNTNVVEITSPVIEGWINPSEITVEPDMHYKFSLSVREAR